MSIRPALILCLALSIAACASTRSDGMKLNQQVYNYHSLIRWGNPAAYIEFVDPELREDFALSPLSQSRLEQLKVTAYNVQSSGQVSDEEFRQVVEIRVVNQHTQVERSVIDRQVWVWDSKAGAWWLTTRLPDFAPR